MNNNILETETTKRRVFHARVQTNKEGLIDQISPIYGLKSIADKSDMDFVIDLVPFDQPISESKVDYSTDHFSDDQIPSIMEEAFRNIDTAASEDRTPTDKQAKDSYQASIDKRDLKMQEEAFKADQRAPDAEEEANREAYEIWLEDRKADAAQGDQSSFEAPKTSAEADFWDEPNSDGNVVPFENTQTVNDKILTVRQTALLMFNNDSKEAMAIIHSKKMRKDLGAYSKGKGCKVFIPESKVRAFIAKQPKRLAGMAMYLPEHKMIGRTYHS